MPHIIVVADSEQGKGEDAVMLSERISTSDLESNHFAARLLERLEWAVGDAHDAEQELALRAEPATRQPLEHRAQQATERRELVGSPS